MARRTRFASSFIPARIGVGAMLCALLVLPVRMNAQSSAQVANLPPRAFGANALPSQPATAATLPVTTPAQFAPSLANNWTPLTHQPGFRANTALLLTDGRVLVQVYGSTSWYTLTPDHTGSYLNGTWSPLGSSPMQCYDTRSQAIETWAPLYMASAVLPDGRVVIMGGEYNLALGGGEVWTNLGEIYNPTTNTWSCLSSPSGWNQLGDAMSVVLPNGTFLLGDAIGDDIASLDLSTNTPRWTIINPTGKSADSNGYNNEEGWTLLPNGKVLTLDVWNSADGTTTPALQYNPATTNWDAAGTAPDPLTLLLLREIGPATLRPDGTVFASGATGKSDIYNTGTSVWTSGPTFPTAVLSGSCGNGSYTNVTEQFAPADAPAALLPDGHVLIEASPVDSTCDWIPPAEFFEFDGTNLTQVAATANSFLNVSFNGRLLPLPNGQIFFDDTTGDAELYSPTGAPYAGSAPTITTSPAAVGVGATNMLITGTQLNGLSGAAAYGDDYQAATNYPLVRITNLGTGDVFYARTHGFSTMGVATGGTAESTYFDVPATIETGSSSLVVVANGIASASVPINILPASATALVSSANPSANGTSVTFTATVSGGSGTPTGTVTFYDGTNSQAVALASNVTLIGGVAAYATSTLSIGSHTITATYSGDVTLGSSTSPALPQVVNGQATTTAVMSATNPSPLNATVMLSATVTPAGSGTPTGTVMYLDSNSTLDGNTVLGTVTLSSGIAPSITAPLQFAGTHPITAVYSGDATFSGSTSTALAQVVDNPVPTGVSLQTPNILVGTGGTREVVLSSNASFVIGAVVNFNGTVRATQFSGENLLFANFLTADFLTAGVFPVTVTNPGPGGGASAPVNFTVNNPQPTITSFLPAHAPGGVTIALTVNGTNFVSGATMSFGGNAETVTFVSSTQLTTNIVAADNSAASAQVTVINPAPSVAGSLPANFPVDSFTVSGPANPVTVGEGQTARFTISVAPTANGYPNAVTLSVSNLPPDTTAMFSQNAVTPNGTTQMLTLTLDPTARGAAPVAPKDPGPPIGLQIILLTITAALGLARLAMRKRGYRTGRWATAMPTLLLFASLAFVESCSSSGATGPPPGTYPFTVTATSGTMSTSTTVTLTVN